MHATPKNVDRCGVAAGKSTDARVIGCELYLLPVATRVPLKFGAESLTSVTCARVRLRVVGRDGRSADGWGETPLSVQWAWPSELSYAERHEAMIAFCRRLTGAWAGFDVWGHPLEIGDAFQATCWAGWPEFNRDAAGKSSCHIWRRWCAARRSIWRCTTRMACCTACRSTRRTTRVHEPRPGGFHCRPARMSRADFRGKFPADFLARRAARTLPAWHLVGGLDPLERRRADGPRAERRLPGAAGRLDRPRRARLPEGQAARQ